MRAHVKMRKLAREQTNSFKLLSTDIKIIFGHKLWRELVFDFFLRKKKVKKIFDKKLKLLDIQC